MSLPLIGPDGVLPPVSKVREFGLMLDLRDKTLKTYNELGQVVAMNLGGSLDISGYVGHNQAITNPPVDCPAHIAAGELTTLNDVVLHIYYSSKGSDGIPPPIGESTTLRTVHHPVWLNLAPDFNTASRTYDDGEGYDAEGGVIYGDYMSTEFWCKSVDSFSGRHFLRLGRCNDTARVGLDASEVDYTAGDYPIGSGIENDPTTLNKVLVFDGTNLYTGEGAANTRPFTASFTEVNAELIDIVIDTHSGEVWLGLDGVWLNDPMVDPPTLTLEAGLKWRICAYTATPGEAFAITRYDTRQPAMEYDPYLPSGAVYSGPELPPVNDETMTLWLTYKSDADGTRARLYNTGGTLLDESRLPYESGRSVMSGNISTMSASEYYDDTKVEDLDCTVESLGPNVDYTLPKVVQDALEEGEKPVAKISHLRDTRKFQYQHAILIDDKKGVKQGSISVPYLVYKITNIDDYSDALRNEDEQ